MIIPTPEFDPMYAQDGVPFREKMLARIARDFGDELGAARLEEIARAASSESLLLAA